MKLDDDHRIVRCDKYNIALEIREDVKDRKTGEIIRKEWKCQGFYGLILKNALKKYMNIKLIDNASSVENILSEINRLEKKIDEIAEKDNIDLSYCNTKKNLNGEDSKDE